MAAKDPVVRSAAASIAALTRWSKQDGKEQAARMQRGLMAKFEREVDPEGVLPVAERQKRAKRARRAHMIALSLLARKARLST